MNPTSFLGMHFSKLSIIISSTLRMFFSKLTKFVTLIKLHNHFALVFMSGAFFLLRSSMLNLECVWVDFYFYFSYELIWYVESKKHWNDTDSFLEKERDIINYYSCGLTIRTTYSLGPYWLHYHVHLP